VIPGVNCPEGMVLSPNGSWLYTATQCDGGHGPVFLIATTTDGAVEQARDLAVGGAITTSHNRKNSR